MRTIALAFALFAITACGSNKPTTGDPGTGTGTGETGTGGGDPGQSGACIKTGCSGTVCTEAGNDVVTTCEFKPEYACYQQATCEKQADGKCGWTQTETLTACLANPPAQ